MSCQRQWSSAANVTWRYVFTMYDIVSLVPRSVPSFQWFCYSVCNTDSEKLMRMGLGTKLYYTCSIMYDNAKHFTRQKRTISWILQYKATLTPPTLSPMAAAVTPAASSLSAAPITAATWPPVSALGRQASHAHPRVNVPLGSSLILMNETPIMLKGHSLYVAWQQMM